MSNKTTRKHIQKHKSVTVDTLRKNAHRTRVACVGCATARLSSHVSMCATGSVHLFCVCRFVGIRICIGARLDFRACGGSAARSAQRNQRKTKHMWPDLIFKESSLELLVHNSSDRADAYIQNTHKTKYTAAGVRASIRCV